MMSSHVNLVLLECGKVMEEVRSILITVYFDHRLLLDEYYYRNWSFWLDITLLFKTVKQVLYGEGAV